MRKIFFALLAITFVSSLCFAEEVSAPAGTETVTGRIDSVSTTGEKPQMTVRGEDGALTVFLIAPDATIIGKDGNVTTLTWIKGNKASMAYTSSPNGAIRTVRSIKVLPDF